jgi:F0F1-type ATP synthase assembly protein I
MRNHRFRYLLIVVTTALTLASLIAASVFKADAAVLSALCGALTVLVPAVVDARSVERRRVTPGARPVEDDVQPKLPLVLR